MMKPVVRSLKSVLEEARTGWLDAGGVVSAPVRKALRAHRRKEFGVFLGMLGILVACLAFSAGLLVAGKTQEAKIFAGLVGVGGGGETLEVMRRVWKDWSQTDLLLVLLDDATDAQVRTLIDKLIRKL